MKFIKEKFRCISLLHLAKKSRNDICLIQEAIVDVKVVVTKSWESESQSSERLSDRVDNSCTNNLIRNTSLVYQQLCLHQHGTVVKEEPRENRLHSLTNQYHPNC